MNRPGESGRAPAYGAFVLGSDAGVDDTLATIAVQSLAPAWVAILCDEDAAPAGLPTDGDVPVLRTWDEARAAARNTAFMLFAHAGDLWFPDHAMTCLHLLADGAPVGLAPALHVRRNGRGHFSVTDASGERVLTFCAVQAILVQQAGSRAAFYNALASAPSVTGAWPTAVHFATRDETAHPAVRRRWVERALGGEDRDLILAEAVKTLVEENAELTALVEARTNWAQRTVEDVIARDRTIRKLQGDLVEFAQAPVETVREGAARGE